MAASVQVRIQPEDDMDARERRFEKFEQVILSMQQPESGIEVKDRKTLLKQIPSCFTSAELLDWLQSNLKFDRNEASIFAHKLFKEGYVFPVEEYSPILDSAEQFLRFQTPYFWPSVSGVPTDFDYAVYLVKCNMKKGAKSMKPYELEAFAKLQKKLRRRWEFVVQQATDQINAAKERTPLQTQIFETQERAFWWVHRPPKKQEASITKAVMEQAEQRPPIDPRAMEAPEWSTNLATLLMCPDGYKMFREHITREHNQENLDFWEACVQFEKSNKKAEELGKEVKTIWSRFLVQNAPNEVNIPATIREQISKRIKAKDCDCHMLSEAQLAIQNLMSKDIYTRFLRSSEYLDLCQQAETATWLAL